MVLHNKLLPHFIRDALGSYSEDFRITDWHNPTQFNLNQKSYSARVSYVHDSGNTRGNDDEVRIQISRSVIDKQQSRANAGMRVVFLGFFEGGKTFVAWDPRHVFSLQANTIMSVYARQSQQERVKSNLAAVYSFKAIFLDEQSFAIALPASALGFYLENIARFHKLTTEDSIIRLMKARITTFVDGGLGIVDQFDFEEGRQRQKFTYERKAYPRDPKFTENVLNAYQQTCCVCDRQLGIIQAAHIIPHSEDDSPNDVQNGLAMCIEHHRLYDDALLLPGPGRKLILNPGRAEYLRQTNQKKGLKGIEEFEGRSYRVPTNPESCPCNEYLEQGISIRMGN